MTISYVYKLTNKINNKCYVGKSNNPATRLVRHFSTAKTGYDKSHKYRYIHRAIAKYGKENFVFEIIETCESEELAYKRECYWIETLKSNEPVYGYNLNAGGLGGKSPNADVRQRISRTLTGRTVTLGGLLRKLHKIFLFIPNYSEIFKPTSEIKREDECRRMLEPLNIQKVRKLNDDAKRTILQLNELSCLYNADIADVLGLKESTVRYVVSRYPNGLISEERKHINRSNAHKGKTLSEEHRKHISESNMGKKVSQEVRVKISEANSGENNGMFGKTPSITAKRKMSEFQSSRSHRPMTEEEKQKLSDNLRGKPRPPPIPLDLKNEVVQYYVSGNYTKHQLSEMFSLKYNSIVKIIRTHSG